MGGLLSINININHAVVTLGMFSLIRGSGHSLLHFLDKLYIIKLRITNSKKKGNILKYILNIFTSTFYQEILILHSEEPKIKYIYALHSNIFPII